MSVGCYTEDHCEHLAFECRGGWHECSDCGRGLGDRSNKLEEHAANQCSLCGPIVIDTCCHDAMVVCENCTTSSCIHNPLSMCMDCIQEVENRLDPVNPHQDEMDVPYGRPPKFVTKDSGERQEYESGMRRDIQEGKPRHDLLYVPGMPYVDQPLTRWASLLERGATKYGEENWTLADSDEELRRFKASAARHFAQWMAGETDEDHMAATFFNMAAVAYMEWKLSE